MSTALIIACCIGAFALGIGFFYIFLKVAIAKNNKENKVEEADKPKKIGTMDVILIIIGIALLVFTITMIIVFLDMGSVPDTLITCVFATFTGECGILGWIKTTKEKNTASGSKNDKEAKG